VRKEYTYIYIYIYTHTVCVPTLLKESSHSSRWYDCMKESSRMSYIKESCQILIRHVTYEQVLYEGVMSGQVICHICDTGVISNIEYDSGVISNIECDSRVISNIEYTPGSYSIGVISNIESTLE